MTNQEQQIPHSIKFADTGQGFRMSYRWYKPKYLIALILAPISAFFLVRSEYVAGDFGEFTLSSALIVIVALLIVYYSLARVINTTRISVAPHRIDVRTGPLPLVRNCVLEKNDVDQLYVTRQVVGHRYYMTVTNYQVNVQRSDGSEVTLVRGLSSAEQGWFIEQKIESFFKIEDIPVEGEVDKS
jgi:hypothetical protein